MILRYGELFCGAGGLAWGALNAQPTGEGKWERIEHAWASDYDYSACQTYQQNIAVNGEVICRDVRELDLHDLSAIDVFAYGFPCNDFSIVGERKGVQGSYGSFYRYGVDVLSIHRPMAFVAENVGGIRSSNEGKAFEHILRELSTAGNGYDLTVHLYKAEDYGVPQTRHRYIIVGIDQILGKTFRVPAPTHLGIPVTAQQALSDIPPNALNHDITPTSSHVTERLKHIKPGENAWTADLPPELRLNVKNVKLSQIYRRLHPHKPSYTITGSGGGGTHGYHYDEPRPLTNRERARLQTFPDNYFFIGSKEQVRKQIGMAVPPLLSLVVFRALLDTLNGISYNSISPNYTLRLPSQKRLF
jgi:DNA (cytosine-5)-methyltransferase 1